jgi:hypothetical protein
MVGETYAAFAGWDLSRSKKDNLGRLHDDNYIGAKSATWLRDIGFVLSRRFDPDERDRSLVLLAQNHCPIDEWKPIQLWHITRDEFLLRDFLQNWLFPAFEAGTYRMHPEELHPYLRDIPMHGGITEHPWTESTINHVAAALLKTSADFGLLRGTMAKEFASYHLPERSFLYLLHAIRDEQQSANKVVAADDWRMFLMRPAAVESELLRLHQYKKLHYEVAGSLVQLSLPNSTALEYAEAMAA